MAPPVEILGKHAPEPNYEIYSTIIHPRAITSIKFSPNGKWLATASVDHEIRIFDAETGDWIRNLNGHGGPVNYIAFSPDNFLLASVSDDRTIKLWGFPSGKFLKNMKSEPPLYLFTICCFDSKSKTLVAATHTGNICLYDVNSGWQFQYYPVGLQRITSFNSTKGCHMLTSTHSGKCFFWEIGSGLIKRNLARRNRCPVLSGAISPDETHYIESLLNNALHLREFDTGVRTKIYNGHRSSILGVTATFSYTGAKKLVISGSEDNRVFIWDMETTRLIQRLVGHEDVVLMVEAHPTKTIIASSSRDNTVKIWKSKF